MGPRIITVYPPSLEIFKQYLPDAIGFEANENGPYSPEWVEFGTVQTLEIKGVSFWLLLPAWQEMKEEPGYVRLDTWQRPTGFLAEKQLELMLASGRFRVHLPAGAFSVVKNGEAQEDDEALAFAGLRRKYDDEDNEDEQE